MDLVLWRHCDAEDGAPDETRRLTPRGLAQAARMAAWLARNLPADCRILVSPATRARQTAEALGRPFETVAALAPGASVGAVLDAAGWPDAHGTALVVGHEPALGRVAGRLLGGEASELPLAKGAIIWLVDRAPPGGVDVALKLARTPESA
jgi:phosphohistidine phosphatase